MDFETIDTIYYVTSMRSRRITTVFVANRQYRIELPDTPNIALGYLLTGVRDLVETEYFKVMSIAAVETAIHRLRSELESSTPFDAYQLIAFARRRGRYSFGSHAPVLRTPMLDSIIDTLPKDLRERLNDLPLIRQLPMEPTQPGSD